MSFTPADHVTEREVGSGWEDCTFASMLETMRVALPSGRNIPATIDEVNRFRAAAGFPDAHKGVTIEQTLPAAKRLYGLNDDQYTLTREWEVLQPLLENPNAVCAITGWMGAVPALQVWDTFTGAHCVAKHDVLVWCDPLAPHGTYKGQAITLAQWRAFFTALPGSQAFIMSTGGSIMPINTSGYNVTSEKTAVVKSESSIYDEPGGAIVGRTHMGGRYVAIGIISGHIACLFSSGTPWPDHLARPTVLFVPQDTLTLEDAPVSTDSASATLQRKWEAWVATHPTG